MRQGNAKVRKPTDTLSAIWPKAAIFVEDESRNKLLTQVSDIPANTEGMLIVEPLFEGWGESGKERLLVDGMLITYTTSSGGGDNSGPIISLNLFKTSTGESTIGLRYHLDGSKFPIGGAVLEDTNWMLTNGVHDTTVGLYGESPLTSKTGAGLDAIFLTDEILFITSSGRYVNTTTGVDANFLQGSDGVVRGFSYTHNDSLYIKDYAYVNESYIVAVVGDFRIAATDEELASYKSWIYVWDREGKYVGHQEINRQFTTPNMYYGQAPSPVIIFDCSSTVFYVSVSYNFFDAQGVITNVIPSYRLTVNPGGVPMSIVAQPAIVVEELAADDSEPFAKMFSMFAHVGADYKPASRDTDGNAYYAAGLQFGVNKPGLYKIDASGVIWSATPSTLLEDTKIDKATLTAFSHYKDGKVYVVGVRGRADFTAIGEPDGVGVVEVDAATGAVLRRTNFYRMTGSDGFPGDMPVSASLVNENGVLAVMSSRFGFWLFDLNTMTLIKMISKATGMYDMNSERACGFTDGDGNFWFSSTVNGIANYILGATGDSLTVLNTGKTDGAQTPTATQFEEYVTALGFTNTTVYRANPFADAKYGPTLIYTPLEMVMVPKGDVVYQLYTKYTVATQQYATLFVKFKKPMPS